MIKILLLVFSTGFQNGLAILDINQVEFLDSSVESKEQRKVAAQIGKGELPGSFHIDLPSAPTHLVRYKKITCAHTEHLHSNGPNIGNITTDQCRIDQKL
jgi:hypothetical protein